MARTTAWLPPRSFMKSFFRAGERSLKGLWPPRPGDQPGKGWAQSGSVPPVVPGQAARRSSEQDMRCSQFSSWNIGMYEIPTMAPSGDCSLATV